MADDGHRKPKREDQVYASSSAQYRILVSREAFVVNKETLSKLCNNYCAVSGARKRKREREREELLSRSSVLELQLTPRNPSSRIRALTERLARIQTQNAKFRGNLPRIFYRPSSTTPLHAWISSVAPRFN